MLTIMSQVFTLENPYQTPSEWPSSVFNLRLNVLFRPSFAVSFRSRKGGHRTVQKRTISFQIKASLLREGDYRPFILVIQGK